METIIITVTDFSKRFMYDLETPLDVKIGKLKLDILETLKGYNEGLFESINDIELFFNRQGKQLLPEETLIDAGVWNGDFITIIDV